MNRRESGSTIIGLFGADGQTTGLFLRAEPGNEPALDRTLCLYVPDAFQELSRARTTSISSLHFGMCESFPAVPRTSKDPDDFKSFFCAREGWGSFTERSEGNAQQVRRKVNWGTVRVKTLCLATANNSRSATVAAFANGERRSADFQVNGGTVKIDFGEPLVVKEREALQIPISYARMQSAVQPGYQRVSSWLQNLNEINANPQ